MEKRPFRNERNGTNKVELNLGVCSGRHEMPVDNFVFDKIVDPTDVKALEGKALEWYRSNVTPLIEEGLNVDINIYVTGLTVATIAIVKVFQSEHEFAVDYDNPTIVHNGQITLWHFNAAGGDYYPQPLFDKAKR